MYGRSDVELNELKKLKTEVMSLFKRLPHSEQRKIIDDLLLVKTNKSSG